MGFSINLSFQDVSLVYERFSRKPWIVILKPRIVMLCLDIFSLVCLSVCLCFVFLPLRVTANHLPHLLQAQ